MASTRARARQHLRHLRRGGARGGGGGSKAPPRHRRAGAARGVDSHRAILPLHTAQFPLHSQGAELVKKSDLNARFVFVAPPSYDELEKRLRGRGTETEKTARQVRLKNAREMEYMDRPGRFDAVIVNADLDRAYSELKFALLLGPPPPPK